MERLPLLEPPVFDDLAGLLGRDRALAISNRLAQELSDRNEPEELTVMSLKS
jgi:hypothetical protein